MNHTKTILRLAAATPLIGAASADLIITGVIDGPLTGGVPKAVELYATDDIADLSLYGIGSANNGGGTDGEEFTLSGSATEGQFLYVASEGVEFQNFFGFAPDFTDAAAGINGDDAIELFQSGSVIDVFGDISVDGTGEAWEYADGWAYRVDETGPDATTFAIANWSFSGVGALNGETTNGSAATPFPIGTYTPAGPVPPAAPEEVSLYQAILTGEGSGEVVSHARIGTDFVLAVTDNPNGGVTILNWIDGNQKYQIQFSIDVLGAVANAKGVSSVALDPRGTGLGAAVVQVDDPAINTTGDLSIPQIGAIVFFDATTGTVIGQAPTGYHPDMVAFGPNGYCVVANEAEYAWDEDSETALPANNQNGSVSLYDLSGVSSGDLAPAASVSGIHVDFTTAPLTGVRYGTADEMEPEYVAFDATGDAIFVGCQENNAVGVLKDLAGIFASTSSPAWEIYDLGGVTYTADASDKDGIDISDVITGLHMPDAIAVYEAGGKTYVVTADEGDARPDDSDITRAGDFASTGDDKVAATPLYDAGSGPLTQAQFDALLQDEDALGRIDILIDQATDINGDLTDMVCLGTRGISVFEYDGNTSSLTRVSHLSLESYLSQEDPSIHNANDGGDPGEFDKRSDNKGSEPEAVSVIQLGSKMVAMVGNERQNGVVMVDITDPANPAPISYLNNRDNGLNAPETVQTISAADSPTGAELAIFGYEGDSGISGGIGIYNLENSESFNLTILHNNDGESDLFSYKGSADHGGIARFKTAMDAHHDFFANIGHGVVEVFAGDSFLAGPEFAASLESGAPGSRTFYDALALSRIGYDAFAIGNHEMDFGPDVLAEFIGDAQTTHPSLYLSANLDFANEADMLAQVTSGNVASSAVVEVATAGGMKKVGIIGATTDNLPFISSPRDTIISAVAASVNAQVASLQGQNVDAIVLVSHLQGIATDQDLVPALASGIDVIVAGGGDELLVDEAAASPRSVYGTAAPASVIDTSVFLGDDGVVGGTDGDADDAIEGSYPTLSTATDLGGNQLPIVTGAGSYGYLNRLTLNFSGSGVTIDSTSNPALIVSDTADATNGFAADADVTADIAPVQTFLDALAATVIGNTDTTLPQSSNLIRSDERAVGNLVADAYLAKGQELAAGFGVDVPQVAMANGGGIRAAVPAGDITLQTTFNVSPFGNFVAVVEDVTTADLKILLENCYSKTVDDDPTNGVDPQRSGDGTGRFAQIAGMDVVYDISKPALVLDGNIESVTTPGTRIVSARLDNGTDLIVDGQPVPNLTVDIAMPAFTAAGGDQWFRYASNGTAYYTSVQYPYTALGVTDQQALADYVIGLDGTVDGTGPAIDGNDAYNESIKDGRILTISDRDSDGLLDQIEEALGTDPDVNEQDPATQLAAIAAKQAADVQTGEDNVTGDPLAFNLYTETSILDLSMNGVMGAVTNPGVGGTAVLDIDVYSSPNLGAPWTLEATEQVTVQAPADKYFYRLNAEQP